MSRTFLKGQHILAALVMLLVAGVVGTAPAQANPSINWTVSVTSPALKSGNVVSSYSIRADRGYTAKISLLRAGRAVATKTVATAGTSSPVTGTISKVCLPTATRSNWQTTVEIRSSTGLVIARYVSGIVPLACA